MHLLRNASLIIIGALAVGIYGAGTRPAFADGRAVLNRIYRKAERWQYHRYDHAGGGIGEQHAMKPIHMRIDSDAIVAFSPNGDATHVIVSAIDRARRQILVQAYSFTSSPIIHALAKAEERGVQVLVIADKSNDNSRYSGVTYMVRRGVPVWIDGTVHIAHNKVMIFDRKSVLTGSFNFSMSAQKYNAENILLIENDPKLAKVYIKNWKWRKSLSHKF